MIFLVGLLAGLGVSPRQERVCAGSQAGPSLPVRAWYMCLVLAEEMLINKEGMNE